MGEATDTCITLHGKYDNLSSLDNVSFLWMELSKDSQSSCHLSTLADNFLVWSLGSFTFAQTQGLNHCLYGVDCELKGLWAVGTSEADGSGAGFINCLSLLSLVLTFALIYPLSFMPLRRSSSSLSSGRGSGFLCPAGSDFSTCQRRMH